MNDPSSDRHAARSRLVLGLFLLALGVLMLAVNLGYDLPPGWWKYFPLPLMALGLWGLLFPSRHLDRSGGIWLLAAGTYCLISLFNIFGLGWSSAWPVFVIAAGLGFMVGRDHPCDRGPNQEPPPGG